MNVSSIITDEIMANTLEDVASGRTASEAKVLEDDSVAISCYSNGTLPDSGYLFKRTETGYDVFAISPDEMSPSSKTNDEITVRRMTPEGIDQELFFGRHYYTDEMIEEILNKKSRKPEEQEEIKRILGGARNRLHMCNSWGYWADVAKEGSSLGYDPTKGFFENVDTETTEEVRTMYLEGISDLYHQKR